MTNYARLAIVTGADSGIGRATAELLATEGYDVGLTCHEDVEGARGTAAGIEQRGQRAFVEPSTPPPPTPAPSSTGSWSSSAASVCS